MELYFSLGPPTLFGVDIRGGFDKDFYIENGGMCPSTRIGGIVVHGGGCVEILIRGLVSLATPRYKHVHTNRTVYASRPVSTLPFAMSFV